MRFLKTKLSDVYRNPAFVLAFVNAIVALLTGVLMTWNGVNTTMDSFYYLGYARRLQIGEGFSLPISGRLETTLTQWIITWSPLYPAVLSPGVDLASWARFISIACLVVTALCTYHLATRIAQNPWYGTAASLFFLSIPAVSLNGFSFAMSEPLFIALTMLGLCLLTRESVTNRPNRPVLWAMLCAALAAITRYLGAAFILLGAVYLVADAKRRKSALIFLVAALPLGLYSLYLRGLTGSFAGNQSTSNPISLQGIPLALREIIIELAHGLTNAFQWIGLHSNWLGVSAGGLLFIFGAVRAWPMVRAKLESKRSLASLHGVLIGYILIYLLVFWVLSARASNILAEPRHFVVLYPVLAVLLVDFFRRARLALPLAVLVAISGVASVSYVRQSAEGLGYNAPEWRNNPILTKLRETIPPNTLIHGMDVGYLWYTLQNSPVRAFGGDEMLVTFRCEDAYYPPEYRHMAFTLFNTPLITTTPIAAMKQRFSDWIAPCGTIITYQADQFALVALVERRR